MDYLWKHDDNQTTLEKLYRTYKHDPQSTLKEVDRLYKLRPYDSQILRLRGQVKVELHDYQGALKDLNRLCELHPYDLQILRLSGQVRVEVYDYQGALEDLNRADKVYDPYNSLTLLGEVEGLHEYYARENINRPYEFYPYDSPILRSRGVSLLELKRLVRRLVELGRAYEFLVHNARVKDEVELHDYQGALNDLNRAFELDPSDSRILRARGVVKIELLDYRGALEDLNKSFALDPYDSTTLRVRGHVKRMMGNFMGSIIDWSKAHGVPYNDTLRFGNQAIVKRRLDNYGGVEGQLNDIQEITFLLDIRKLVLQIAVFVFVFVFLVFTYLMGYVERGRWGTYSNGTWEFRATYVCIELRLGAYPFQKFRDKPPSSWYSTIRRKNGKYEPFLKFSTRAIYFRKCKTRVEAAFTLHIAKLCLGIKDKINMLYPQQYDHLQKISLDSHSRDEITKIVSHHAQVAFESIKKHLTDVDSEMLIVKAFENGAECATNGHQICLNEKVAPLHCNGGGDHVTKCGMDFNGVEALLNSPNDDDVSATAINQFAQNLGEFAGDSKFIQKIRWRVAWLGRLIIRYGAVCTRLICPTRSVITMQKLQEIGPLVFKAGPCHSYSRERGLWKIAACAQLSSPAFTATC